MVKFQVRPAKKEELEIGWQQRFMAGFLQMSRRYWWQNFGSKVPNLVFELSSIDQQTRFLVASDIDKKDLLYSQVMAAAPRALIEEAEDQVTDLFTNKPFAIRSVKQVKSWLYPIKILADKQQVDVLVPLWTFLGKLKTEEAALMQLILKPINTSKYERIIRSSWQIKDRDGNMVAHPDRHWFEEKLKTTLVKVEIRMCFWGESENDCEQRVGEMISTLGDFYAPDANALTEVKMPRPWRQGLRRAIEKRRFYFLAPKNVFNIAEVAGLWHLPDVRAQLVPNICWGRTLLVDPPDNLPVDNNIPGEINFFAKTEWRNQTKNFGIKTVDRRKHMYMIGKTGTGKSTLIANMAINDIRNNKGVAVIDPHGDLAELLLDFVPKRRLGDVIYLDPSLSSDRSFALNLFENRNGIHLDLIASGIVTMFQKLYHHSWGPRLEYILRNTIISLLYCDGATFADIIALLTNKDYRKEVVNKVKNHDQVLANFWNLEFEQMNDKLRTEAVSPILNKVGQFLSSQRIRQVVGKKRSTFSIAEIMKQKKILIVNLSQGKLGEDTAALLGSMFITQIQLAAMERVSLAEAERSDFYLYVDEFQNFATRSFIKILSEARKYHLNLILANQYVAQVDEEIQKAIFGNVGTLVTFLLGAQDAGLFVKEFGSVFAEDDLVGLRNHEIILKMSIDKITSQPFSATTLPLPAVVNRQKDKICRQVLERYYVSIKTAGK